MEELINNIKKYIQNGNNRKFINNLLLILIFTVALLMFLNSVINPNRKQSPLVIKEEKREYTDLVETDYSLILEKKLEVILSKLKGVGEVHVMVTLEDSLEKIPATNKTKVIEATSETDSEGGKREVTREDETAQLVNLSNEVIILKEIKPNIKGVIVVAEGAEDSFVLETIYEAVKTVLGITGNRIQVFSSK